MVHVRESRDAVTQTDLFREIFGHED
jgi:hypothetical protein